MQYLKKEVREKIIVAAIKEFKDFGYADASIRNIANNAEISLGNIYRYFDNKEALYFAVINPFLDSIKRVMENEFQFHGNTMQEMSEKLVEFLTQHNDELLIIRKGQTVHYESFVGYISEVISRKVKQMITSKFAEIHQKIRNSEFYDAIAESFLTALFRVLKNSDKRNVQQRSLRELITFFFGHMKDRFNSYVVVEDDQMEDENNPNGNGCEGNSTDTQACEHRPSPNNVEI